MKKSLSFLLALLTLTAAVPLAGAAPADSGLSLSCASCVLMEKETGAVLLEDEGETETYQIVTTLRQDALRGIISKESPMGRALMGRRAGARATVELDNGYSYEVVIQAIEKGEDDGSLPLNRF